MEVTDYQYQYHPYCKAVPEKSPEDFANHVASIKEFGQREPVKLYEGMILDGRNNERACREAGISVWYEEFVGDDKAAHDYAVWKNHDSQRNWTKSMRAASIYSVHQVHEERQRVLGTLPEVELDAGRVPSTLSDDEEQDDDRVPRTLPAKTLEELAAEASVSRATYVSLGIIAKKSPELLEEVKAGKKSIKAAVEEVHVRAPRKNKPKLTQLEAAQKRAAEAIEMAEHLKDAVREYEDEIAELKAELLEVTTARDAYLLAMEGNVQQAIDAALEREKAALQIAKQANIQNDISLRQKGVAIETLKREQRANSKVAFHS